MAEARGLMDGFVHEGLPFEIPSSRKREIIGPHPRFAVNRKLA